MRFLGIDYGKKHIGLALATSIVAEPLRVLKVKSFKEAVSKVLQVMQVEQVEQVVVGLSEGKMAAETKRFGERLRKEAGLKVSYQDETLTSKDAQTLSIQAGIKRKKRKEMVHAYSAALILQEHLNENSEDKL